MIKLCSPPILPKVPLQLVESLVPKVVVLPCWKMAIFETQKWCICEVPQIPQEVIEIFVPNDDVILLSNGLTFTRLIYLDITHIYIELLIKWTKSNGILSLEIRLKAHIWMLTSNYKVQYSTIPNQTIFKNFKVIVEQFISAGEYVCRLVMCDEILQQTYFGAAEILQWIIPL